jgi:FixJ family two-component response regulator
MNDLTVFIVDDDPLVLKALKRVLVTNGFTVETYDSASGFLERPTNAGLGCLLLDLLMPDLNGLDVQNAMTKRGIVMPIVFLSARGDVPSTARAMREGAVDFLVKPVDEQQLLDAIARARDKAIELHEKRRLEQEAEERLARLTKREREVCGLVVQGLLNKQIASELGASEKTVKVHRGRVMHKLGVDSVAALIRLMSHSARH